MAAKKTKKKTAATKPAKARKARTIRVTGAEPETAGAPAEGGKLRLGKLSVEELQAMYKEVVGRETGSDNKAYLMWKIREAKKGRIRVGPARAREIKGPQLVLSVRVDEEAVPLLDAAWRKHGLRSRNDLVLRALGRELARLGETDAAQRFEEASA
ncbi:MAG TPA: hypothetical protein VGG39_37490 [Polyangiaceae bacterium]|jgi:hypothetical protein